MIKNELNKWDKRFIDLATMVGGWSKEPRSRVGAVIVRPDRSIASLGFNGFPRGVDDSDERLADRPLKNSIAVHAEMNAILAAHSSVQGCTIYVTPLLPCSHCAGAIVQSGIKRVVATCGQMSQDWLESAKISQIIFDEAGVDYLFVVE